MISSKLFVCAAEGINRLKMAKNCQNAVTAIQSWNLGSMQGCCSEENALCSWKSGWEMDHLYQVLGATLFTPRDKAGYHHLCQDTLRHSVKVLSSCLQWNHLCVGFGFIHTPCQCIHLFLLMTEASSQLKLQELRVKEISMS